MNAIAAALGRVAERLKRAERRTESALRPAEISALGWLELVWTMSKCTLKHRQPSQAAAATFYAFLSFIPAVAAFGCLYGWAASPDHLHDRLSAFSELAPAGVIELVQREAVRFAGGDRDRLLLQAVGFAAVALLSATSAVRQVMVGLNIAYGAQEGRPWWWRRLLGFSFALGVACTLAFVGWLVFKSLDLSDERVPVMAMLRLVLRWVFLFFALLGALALLYRYAPDRPRARWRWVAPGSALAAAATLVTSAGMTVYLAHFAAYERTYGGLGSIMGMLVWLWALMTVVLAGAELNRALEAKTSADTSITGRASE